MEKEKNNKGVIALLVALVIVLSILCVLFATDTISLKSRPINNNKTDQNANNSDIVNKNQANDIINNELDDNHANDIDNDKLDNTSKTETNIKNTVDEAKISLTNQYEDFNFHNLKLHFRGSKIDDSYNYFYSLGISLNDKNINTKFFSDYNYLNISNEFFVYLIDDIYVLRAFIPRQGYTSDVLILDKDGKILKAFRFVSFSFEDGKINITDPNYAYNTYIHNMSPEGQKKSEEFIKNYTYIVNGSKLIEQ